VAVGLYLFDWRFLLSGNHIWALSAYLLLNRYCAISHLCFEALCEAKWSLGVGNETSDAKYRCQHASNKAVDRNNPGILWFAYRLRGFADKLSGLLKTKFVKPLGRVSV
jgi:hypothetical protein